jgi:hypothetical protein
MKGRRVSVQESKADRELRKGFEKEWAISELAQKL